ncbi:dsDNA nuclease domain-containing protein [Leuconostoc mesenteroides]|uniref:dsDNA nuclease domain-containing protein n=1 Tax=Leuconostoc mesenteroides TaxID=1245 RepID=UPI0030D02EEC
MSVSDNGGAIAIKGFNFQKASAILVMLHNLDDENLIFIPESKEDFEVRNDKLVYYVQVKSIKSLSLSKMLSQKKKQKKIPHSWVINNRKKFGSRL